MPSMTAVVRKSPTPVTMTALAWATCLHSSMRFPPRYWASTMLVPMQIILNRICRKKMYCDTRPTPATACWE